MSSLQKFFALLNRRKLDAEMAEEMRAHLELQTVANIERGMSPDEARYAARRQFGGVEQVKEIARAQRRGAWFEHVRRDVRFAWRGLGRNPGFSAVAIGTLALGIGASSAIFSVVETFLLRPLPFANPHQLVSVQSEMPGLGRTNVGTSVPEFEDLRDRSGVFVEMSIAWPMSGNLTGVDQPQRVEAMAVSSSYFRLLGVNAALGRIFGTEEEKASGWAEGCVLSHAAWQRHFGGDPAVLERKIWLDYDTYRVIGVMPPEFRHPGRTLTTEVDVWIASGLRTAPFPAKPERARRNIPGMIGRIQAGITLPQAEAKLSAFVAETREQFPVDYPAGSNWGPRLQPLQETLVASARPVLWVLLGAVALLLLICCATLANLLLVRGSSRRSELAVRVALGASRATIVRQLLTESALLALAGGVGGLVLAWWLPPLIVGLAPVELPRINALGINGAVLGFTFVVSCLTGLGFGLVPAWTAAKVDLVTGLKARDLGKSGARLRTFFVVGQVAMSLVLLAGGGLLLKSLWRVVHVDPGFRAEGITLANIWLPPPSDPNARQAYRNPAHRTAFAREVMRRLQTLPGVEDVALGTGQCVPLASGWNATTFVVEGETLPGAAAPTALFSSVSPHYFGVLGIQLQRGRLFAESDEGEKRVAVVNAAAAARFWPKGDPINRRITLGAGANAQLWEIVGVVGNVKTQALDAPDAPQIYVPVYQRSTMGVTVFLRSAAGAPAPTSEAIRGELHAIDRDLPLFGVRPLAEVAARSLAQRRFAVVVIGAFAGVALALAGLGLYGVLALAVTQRRREIGVRMAVGAGRPQIFALIVRQGLLVAAAGLGAGLIAALAMTRAIRGLLFQTSVLDVATYGAIMALLGAVTLLACWLPARRATRVNPVEALRSE
jgi:predicted permease